MKSDRSYRFADLLADLLDRRNLSAEQVRALWLLLQEGELSELQIAAALIALSVKGETADELAAAACVMREHMVRLDTGRDDVLDTCGIGGKPAGMVNISTAAALVVAGAGVPVVKHGNRSMTGPTGSADALSALGVAIDGGPEIARRSLAQCGLAFCFAPRFHPAWHRLAEVRKRLAVRTTFNLLGPLANPAAAKFQLLGVSRPELLDPMAGALRQLGTRRALVVCSTDGLDEISLSAPTQVRQIEDGKITSWEWTSRDFGLEPCSLAELRVHDSNESAARIQDVLRGQDGAVTRTVLANAAAALWLVDRVPAPAAGVAMAAASIRSGQAAMVLDRLIACTQETEAVTA
jgi:anthranilate phosphoribosyltransferase